MKITFLGASQNVTGSCYLLQINDKNILIDYGMFQEPNYMKYNYLDLPIPVNKINLVVLTHAHLDHCGLLPKLYKSGYTGPIICSDATHQLASEILLDSAKIQESNFYFRKQQLIYDTRDALGAISLFSSQKENLIYNFDGNISITLFPASHILGASSVYIQNKKDSFLFSGDLGRRNPQIINTYHPNQFSINVQNIVMESLYADMIHNSYENSSAEVIKIIHQTIQRNGNVIIPVFSIHRHQELLMLLVKALKERKLNSNVQIFSDTPLGHKVLKIYNAFPNLHNATFKDISDPYGMNLENVHYINSGKKSLSLYKKKNAIILVGSGMINGGRVLGHLKKLSSDSKSTLLIVGFQAEGTLGREIIQRPKSINIDNTLYPLKIQIKEVYGFSAHADQSDLLWWLSKYYSSNLKNVFLVHSEIEKSNIFKKIISSQISKDLKVYIPSINDNFEL